MAEGMQGAFGELSVRVVEVVPEWAGSPYIVWRVWFFLKGVVVVGVERKF